MYMKVGMRVRMSERGKKHWRESLGNPHNEYGVLEEVLTDEELAGEQEYIDGFINEENFFPYQVVWDNGQYNSYRWLDLDPILPVPDRNLEDYL